MSDDYLVQVSAHRLRAMEAAIDDDTYDAIDKIALLKAEIRKKDQEIFEQKRLFDSAMYDARCRNSIIDEVFKSLDASNIDMTGINEEQDIPIAIDRLSNRIKDLEQQLAKQQAYIGKLEEAWIVADGNILSLHRDHLRLDQVSEEKRLRYRQKAKEALEKLRTG